MQIARRLVGGCCCQAAPQCIVSPRPLEQAFQQGAKVETRTARQDGQLLPVANLTEYLAAKKSVVAGREDVPGFRDVDQVMRNPAALTREEFCRSNIESPINLYGIEVDDFTAETLGDVERQGTLARRGGAEDHYQGVEFSFRLRGRGSIAERVRQTRQYTGRLPGPCRLAARTQSVSKDLVPIQSDPC